MGLRELVETIYDLGRPRRRTGEPGDIGGGGIFSGADPDDPRIMHLQGQSAQPPVVAVPATRPRQVSEPPPVSRRPVVAQNMAISPGPPKAPPPHRGVAVRPRLALPTATDEGDLLTVELPPIPQIARDAQNTVRPSLDAEPLLELIRQRDERAANPVQSPNSRAKSMGLGAWRGFLQGGIPGAVFGLIGHGIDPTQDERYAAAQDVAGYDNRIAREVQSRQIMSGLEKTNADIAKTRAETYRLQHPEVKEITPHYETRENGTYVIDARTPEGRKLSGVPGRPSAERAPKYEWREGVLHRFDEKGIPHPVLGEDGKPWTDPTKVPRKVTVNGETFSVSESEAARIMGGIESADRVAGNKGRELDAQAEADEQNAKQAERDAEAALERSSRYEVNAGYARQRAASTQDEAGKKAALAEERDYLEQARQEREKAEGLNRHASELRNSAKAKRKSAPQSRRQPTTSPSYRGRRISASKIPEAAKRWGVSEAEAKKRIEEAGGVIYY